MKIIKYFESFTKERAKELEEEYKTYLKFLKKEIVENPEEVQNILINIRNYDISKFSYTNKPYDFCIIPDKIFISYLSELNKFISIKIPLDITFNFTYDIENLNLIEFERGIPEILQNIGIGYKLYVFVLYVIKNATTDWRASKKAIHVWRSLILNDKFYCLTSNKISCALLKNQTNEEIKSFLDKIKYYRYNILNFDFDELIFDDELEQKIKEIYGNMDTYKQRNK